MAFIAGCSTSQTSTPLGDSWHDDPQELERTWQASLVRIPDSSGRVIETTVRSLTNGSVQPEGRLPLVIWLHGCDGFWSGTYTRINWLASNGYAVIAPLSLARSIYPTSCNPSTFESGLYRPTLVVRHLDANYAVEKALDFSWIDQNQVLLAGFSEGGAVAATFRDTFRRLKGRIIEAWTCNSGWQEYAGVNATGSEILLSLVAESDPWYQASYHRGDCGEFMPMNSLNQSFIARYEPASTSHSLWEFSEVQEIIRNYLATVSVN